MGLKRMTMGKFPWEHKCKICGQYTIEGEEIYIVYPPQNDKQLTWGIVHVDELESISEGLSEDEKINKLRSIKMPRFKGFTDEQKAKAELFKQACNKKGYYNDTISKRTLKMGRRGTSFKFTYDMITGKIGSHYGGRKGLFDGLIFMQLESEVEAEFKKLQGLEPNKIVTAQSIINKAVEDVDKLMGRK